MQLSIVTTLYKSAPYIDEFYQRITAEAEKITQDYEIIFVDDGSPDNSLEKAVALHQQDSKVTVIELSRNFGHHKAAITGLSHAKGELVFIIDCDLEEEPELLGRFWQELHQVENVDVVYGVQETRKGNWFEKITGGLFWKLFNSLSSMQITANQSTVRLMKADFASCVAKYIREKELFLAANYKYLGFNQKPITIKKTKRGGGSNYTIVKKLQLFTSAITSFSSQPLVFIFHFGLIITSLSIAYILYLLVMRLIYSQALSGWTSLIVSIWFLSGTIMFSIGILGIYLSKVFNEVKDRPQYIIKKIYPK